MVHHNHKHGGRTGGVSTPEYASWQRMRQRCLDMNTNYYHAWGGRGIMIDPAWDDFRIFLADMGPKPSPWHSIERVDNNLGYSKGNCVWATPTDQARNRRSTKLNQNDVNHIKSLCQQGHQQKAVALMFGVSPQLVNHIMRGRKWR